MSKNKTKKWVRKYHQPLFVVLRFLLCLFARIFYGYKAERFKIKKGEKYIIICNHQTTLDPVFLGVAFNKLTYFVSNDDLVHIKYASWWLTKCFGIIPKSKGKSDFKTVKTMLQVLKENGSVGIFPEGNRTFSGELCYINPAIIKFVKSAKAPLIIYNLEGGYGFDPRWAKKIRKGPFKGKIKKVLSVEEVQQMSLEELGEVINSNLNVKEAPTNNEYKSANKAECIERVFYICPECNSKNTLTSKGNNFTCSKCKTTWEYTSHLTIEKDHKTYKYPTVASWYKMQLEDVINKEYHENEIIFEDKDIQLYISRGSNQKELLENGSVQLSKEYIKVVGEKTYIYLLEEITGVCASGKQQVMFRIEDNTYTIRNNKDKRDNFNPVKYVTTINYLKNKDEEFKYEYFGI